MARSTAKKLMNDEACAEVVEILKAIAHPLRLKIVALLCERPEHVSGLSEALDTSQAIVSQQLRILRMGGLVETSRENGFSVYRLADPHLRDLIRCLQKGCKSK